MHSFLSAIGVDRPVLYVAEALSMQALLYFSSQVYAKRWQCCGKCKAVLCVCVSVESGHMSPHCRVSQKGPHKPSQLCCCQDFWHLGSLRENSIYVLVKAIHCFLQIKSPFHLNDLSLFLPLVFPTKLPPYIYSYTKVDLVNYSLLVALATEVRWRNSGKCGDWVGGWGLLSGISCVSGSHQRPTLPPLHFTLFSTAT